MEYYLRKDKGEVKIIDASEYPLECRKHKWQMFWPLGEKQYILFTDIPDFNVWYRNNLMLSNLERGIKKYLKSSL